MITEEREIKLSDPHAIEEYERAGWTVMPHIRNVAENVFPEISETRTLRWEHDRKPVRPLHPLPPATKA